MSATQRITWDQLLNSDRRKSTHKNASDSAAPPASFSADGQSGTTKELRTQIERDHDRILFSAPVRRLADKTQVFPLERNDSVRNRLTHSYEVSNIARSIGTTLVHIHRIGEENAHAIRDIPALLAAIGLVHDLGNPPFGHQGEAAMQSWFKKKQEEILVNPEAETEAQIESKKTNFDLYQDFIRFEGNAQTFRLVTRLQLLNDNFGLDLTYATLAAMMKYPVNSSCVDSSKNAPVSKKKHGYFRSEEIIINEACDKTRINKNCRHPLTYVMEACDDIAYAVLDIEDAVKKGLTSFPDLIAYLEHHSATDPLVMRVVNDSKLKHEIYRKENLAPAELNDVSMQRFRVYAIHELVVAATDTFIQHNDTFMDGTQASSLLKLSPAAKLRELLGNFAREHAFQHRTVLEVELKGYNTITQLMDLFWEAIKDTNPYPCTDDQEAKNRPSTPYDRYVYTRISESYKRVYNSPDEHVKHFPLWYRQCLLLTDMVSGMTDTYAVELLDELKSFKV
ncbi:dGTP triphosphohydrolase [Chromobacterium violaceum]|uniref:dGTP triphosphohydrolase n=1 Tax=Chromobacterium violaceum TaxID=536 RepID=UPI0009D9B0DF|nr:dNTP triphosphohydrolase [Chromobacterium violaceum]OQS24865.1 hypothetical protein B0T41_14795 [Chromobacterium violaceum]